MRAGACGQGPERFAAARVGESGDCAGVGGCGVGAGFPGWGAVSEAQPGGCDPRGSGLGA